MDNIMDPQQELFTLLRVALVKEFGEGKVYDGKLPPGDTPYPFIYLGELSENDVMYKASIGGIVRITVHVWHDRPEMRGTLSQMMKQIKAAGISLQGKTRCFDYRGASETVLPDSTTGQPLLHGVIELNYQYY